MQVFVVSLARSVDRRKFIAGQLDSIGLSYKFIDAVWGKDVHGDPSMYDKKKALKIELRDMTPGEVGCALSHQKAYDEIERMELPYAMIVEDDAVLSSDLPACLEALEPMIRPNDLIQLERCDVWKHGTDQSLWGNYKIVQPMMVKYGSICQAAGYVITREAARTIRKMNRPVYVPADSWGQYRHVINFRGVVPTLSLVKQNVSFLSTTQNYQRSEFTPSTPLSLLVYAFKTRTWLGRTLVRVAKKLLRRS